MPQGGFGNLVALPLQKASRHKENSVFVDDNLDPWPDQWAFLASAQKLRTQETRNAEESHEEWKWSGGPPSQLRCYGETPFAYREFAREPGRLCRPSRSSLTIEASEGWLGGRDSNPDNGVQSAVSYR